MKLTLQLSACISENKPRFFEFIDEMIRLSSIKSIWTKNIDTEIAVS